MIFSIIIKVFIILVVIFALCVIVGFFGDRYLKKKENNALQSKSQINTNSSFQSGSAPSFNQTENNNFENIKANSAGFTQPLNQQSINQQPLTQQPMMQHPMSNQPLMQESSNFFNQSSNFRAEPSNNVINNTPFYGNQNFNSNNSNNTNFNSNVQQNAFSASEFNQVNMNQNMNMQSNFNNTQLNSQTNQTTNQIFDSINFNGFQPQSNQFQNSNQSINNMSNMQQGQNAFPSQQPNFNGYNSNGNQTTNM